MGEKLDLDDANSSAYVVFGSVLGLCDAIALNLNLVFGMIRDKILIDTKNRYIAGVIFFAPNIYSRNARHQRSDGLGSSLRQSFK